MTAYERTHQNTADLHYAGPDRDGAHIIIDAAERLPPFAPAAGSLP